MLLALVLGTRAPGDDAAGVFIPGHEAAAVDLLAPDGLDTFRCGAWTLGELVPGPDCALRFHMSGPGAATAVIRISRDLAASSAKGPESVRACVEARVRSNADPGFFDGKCTHPQEAVRVEVRGVGGSVRLAVLGLGVLLALGLLLWGNRGVDAPPTGTGAGAGTGTGGGGRELLVLAAWVAPALALRAWLMFTLPPGAYELENFGMGAPFAELLQQTGAARGWLDPIAVAFHPPLIRALMDPWLMLGDAMGAGGTLWWLRLPNLGLTVIGLGLLLRLGTLLGAAAAGRLAAILFAWLPATILITVFQGHYAAEMVLCLWFVERTATWIIEGRGVFITLPIAGALALWTGHLAALTVVPGFMLFLLTAHRRGRRREALASTLLLLALYLPIAEAALLGAFSYVVASIGAPLSPALTAAAVASFGHDALPVTTPSLWDAVALPLQIPVRLYGLVGGVIALAAMGLLLKRRRRQALFPVAVLLLYVLAQARLSTRWENLSPLFPLFILGTALGLGELRTIQHRLAARVPLVAVFLAIALVGGAWTAWRHADGTGVTEIVGRVAYEDSETSLAARMMNDRLAHLPVLLLAPADRFPYHLCPDRSTVAGVQACIHAADVPPGEAGFQVYEFGDRTITTAGILGADGEGCPDLGRLLDEPAFGTTYLAVVSWDSVIIAEDSPCEQRFEAEGCDILTRAPGLRLLICGEGTAP